VNAIAVFELFVARRYLVAKRRQAIVSVVTVISVLGVAAGVTALIVALAINNGFRQTLQSLLLGATAHVTVLEKQPGSGIEDWADLAAKLKSVPGVASVAPAVYGTVFFAGPLQSTGGVIKGKADGPADGVQLGAKLAQSTGMRPGSRVTIISPQGELTPFGPRPSYFPMRVSGTFETGFYEIDSSWAFTSLDTAQKILATGNVVNAIELQLQDAQQAQAIADGLSTVV